MRRLLTGAMAASLALGSLLAVPLTVAGATATLVGAGDIAGCSWSGDSETAAVVGGIAGTVFTTGDNVYPDGTDAQFAQCYDTTWGAFKSRTRPSPGNHDYTVAGATGYFGYFGLLAGPSGKGFYAYDLGDWRIYSLNSEMVSVDQLTWLSDDLAANPRQCVAAYWHQPLFSSGQHGNISAVKPLWDILYAAGAELVLSGHDHDYERFAPQTPTGTADPGTGIREVVVGTGGSGLRPFGTVKPNSQVRNATARGALELTLTATGYTGTFWPVAGQTFTDSFSGSCHGAPSGEPGGFTLAATPSGGQVALSWNPLPGAMKYRVKRASATGPYSVLAKVTSTSYVDRSTTAGTTYRYQIVAVTNPATKSNVVTVRAQ